VRAVYVLVVVVVVVVVMSICQRSTDGDDKNGDGNNDIDDKCTKY
jgi:hypothetical protein